jgi:hypothetical protein
VEVGGHLSPGQRVEGLDWDVQVVADGTKDLDDEIGRDRWSRLRQVCAEAREAVEPALPGWEPHRCVASIVARIITMAPFRCPVF